MSTTPVYFPFTLDSRLNVLEAHRTSLIMRSCAVFSPDRVYRYLLWRKWDSSKMSLAFVMLNPSTADAVDDDPTIRRCMSRARDGGFGGVMVVNLFALRSTDPKALRTADNPIGTDNDRWIELVLNSPGPLIAAWGTHGTLHGRDIDFQMMAYEAGKEILCLGHTKGGQPRHPLYLPKDASCLVYQPAYSEEERNA